MSFSLDESPNGGAKRDTHRDADRNVVEQQRTDCGAYSDSDCQTESHGCKPMQALWRECGAGMKGLPRGEASPL